jgi:hypothetical protein
MPGGNTSVLINNSKTSPTTTQHTLAAVSASSHLTQWFVPELTDLVSGWQWREELEDRHKATIRSHVAEHALDFRPPSALYLLRCAGSEAPEDDFNVLLQAAEEREAARKLAEKLRQNHRALAEAKAFRDGYSEEGFLRDLGAYSALRVDRLGRRFSGAAGFAGWHYNTKSVLEDMVGWHKAAKALDADGTLIAFLWDRLKAARAYFRLSAFRADKRVEIAQWQEDVACLRKGLTPGFERQLVVALRRILEHPKALRIVSKQGWENIQAELVVAHDAHSAALARAESEREEERASMLSAWLGGGPKTYSLYDVRPTRIRAHEGVLETTQGASVPLADAIRLFTTLKRCHDAGVGWQPSGGLGGFKVGHYVINSIEADGSVTAGCHYIVWSEAERLAKELGVFEI